MIILIIKLPLKKLTDIAMLNLNKRILRLLKMVIVGDLSGLVKY
jgi:hypothetical protein